MEIFGSLLMFSLLVLLLYAHAFAQKHPHVVFIVADDLGWNDIGYHNSDIISPNIDKLALTGTILNHSYVQPLCSPSRSAFMTGYYPFRMGLQHMVIGGTQNVCVPLNKTFLPQVFKKHGYATHMAGKWHLGFCQKECTPNYRGFDSYYGYYNSQEDYYTKRVVRGYDFRKDEDVDWDAKGNYSTFLYTRRVTEIIQAHDKTRPMFLYFPIQSVHEPLEVPDYYYNLYPNISDKNRRIFSGMVTALDDAIGTLVDTLKATRMYEDTIIFFTADNGGWIPYSGNNYPLRGGKITIWEGGTRVPAFVHSARHVKSGAVYDGMMHAVDWFPTIIEAANLEFEDPTSDGVSQWKAITTLSESPRQEFVYNLDDFDPPVEGKAAIRIGDFKLIEGYPGAYNSWYPPNVKWSGYVPRPDYSDSDHLYRMSGTNWTHFHGLFNLIDDPYERANLYQIRPEIVRIMRERLEYYRKKMVPANYPPADPASNPSHFNGTWSSGWC